MASKNNKCAGCGKTVYLTEKLQVDDTKVFHKACFKCAHCNNIIKLGNFAALEGRYYCKPHFKQLFALKGNYNEGFGTLKHSSKWLNKDGSSSDVQVQTSVTTQPSVPEKPIVSEPISPPVFTETVAETPSSAAPVDEAQAVTEVVAEEKDVPFVGLTAEEVANAEEHFIKYDANGNGSIDRAEMVALLRDVTKGEKSEEEIRSLAYLHFESADKNKDDQLDEQEFLEIYAKLIKVRVA